MLPEVPAVGAVTSRPDLVWDVGMTLLARTMPATDASSTGLTDRVTNVVERNS